ncbi:MAG TPA: hypothetical protein VGA79_07940 [Desulfobaccales bacterium]
MPAILSLPPCHPAAPGLQKLAGRIPETHGKGGQRIGALFQNRIKENPPGYTPPLLKNPFFFCFYFAIILSDRLNIRKFAPKNFSGSPISDSNILDPYRRQPRGAL